MFALFMQANCAQYGIIIHQMEPSFVKASHSWDQFLQRNIGVKAVMTNRNDQRQTIIMDVEQYSRTITCYDTIWLILLGHGIMAGNIPQHAMLLADTKSISHQVFTNSINEWLYESDIVTILTHFKNSKIFVIIDCCSPMAILSLDTAQLFDNATIIYVSHGDTIASSFSGLSLFAQLFFEQYPIDRDAIAATHNVAIKLRNKALYPDYVRYAYPMVPYVKE